MTTVILWSDREEVISISMNNELTLLRDALRALHTEMEDNLKILKEITDNLN